MSKPRKEAKRRSGGVPGAAAPEKPSKGRTKRIDPAHEIATASATEPTGPDSPEIQPAVVAPIGTVPIPEPHAGTVAEGEAVPASPNVSPVEEDAPVAASPPAARIETESPGERIQTQAEQLAGHLRRREKDLDHREAFVNARLAAIDRDTRAARLWLEEREAELTSRTEDLDRRQKSIEQRENELAACNFGLDRCKGDLDQRTAELDRREATLADRCDSLDRREGELTRREAEADRRARHLSRAAAASKHDDLAESQVERARVEAESLREQLREEQKAFQEEIRVQRRRIAEEQRTAMAEVQKQRETVRHRAEQVDRSSAALQQLRAELGRMHRETLEIRLATEELWVQLSGTATPAALTSSLSGIRSKLADHYRFANAELQEQKQELESIRRQLVEQYEKVMRQKQNYDRWAQQHQKDVEADASRLAAREAELRQLQAELSDRSRQWQAQRLDLEQQIRRLTAQRAAQEPLTAHS